jgi:succinate-semialdehyde dehydrogenase/glutarate-semialdehyde dehydrogenase
MARPVTPLSLLIAGEWRSATSGESFDVDDPATGSVFATVEQASVADADAAVAAARDATAAMVALTEFERAELLEATATTIDGRADDLAEQMMAESGKPLEAETRDELAEVAGIFRLAAEETRRIETAVMPSIERTKRVFTYRKPVGVYALLTPFNFPMNIPAELAAAALGGGNAVVLKPSEHAPLSGAAMAQAIVDAGFPPGAINVVHGRGDVGRALVDHDGVDGIGFVGSNTTADAIVRQAGLKRTLIEGSGNGPQIVLDDADLDRAADAAVYGAYFVAGQCCVATERLLVQGSVHDAFVEKLLAAAAVPRLGDPTDPDTTYGPVNNEVVAARMDRHVADATARGATVLTGGERASGHGSDLFWPLTVIDGVTPEMAAFREETFGPIVPITTFDDDDEAVALANDSELGLQAAVFTASLARAYRYIDDLRTGTVLINESTNFWEQHPPFGGAGGTRTGWGRIGGKYTLHDMTDLRTAVIDVR